MASYIDVYTMIVKRIFHGLKNLQDGIAHCEEFESTSKVKDNIAIAQSAEIPSGLTKEDYAMIADLKADVQKIIDKYSDYINKFESFSSTQDPLDILGKKFWMQGNVTR